MKNSKKAWDIFKKILFFFFIIFIIKNNEYVDIKDYLEEEKTLHPNVVSRIGYETSELINDVVTDKLFKIFRYLGKLFIS